MYNNMLDDFITTSIDINADPATIYSILTDLSRYHEWNPHMFEARGDIAVGQTILVRVKAMDVHPTVIVADKDKQLTWSNVLFGVPGLANGDHTFVITPLEYEGDANATHDSDAQGQTDQPSDGGNKDMRRVTKSRLDNYETFWGVAVPGLRLFGLLNGFITDFERVNEALKKRAEEFVALAAVDGTSDSFMMT
ncbi:hypothetical protein B0O80DRAFT_469905 [Mortierella sp. GBAus27b]|nr:hypothetical protein B0O80DRAFT_469838 [Mortierella sp. GBAus27b]KAI8346153.1 hypothetical protein B0O80DRAFT_469905 [Mortierella sp. GBAus27b]